MGLAEFITSRFVKENTALLPDLRLPQSIDVNTLMEINERRREEWEKHGRKNWLKKTGIVNGIHAGIGVSITAKKERLKDYTPRNLYLPDEWRARHVLCLGATGSGKTKLMAYMIMQDILMGNNVCVLNPKSDPLGRDETRSGHELLSYIIEACLISGRLNEFILFTPLFPEVSCEFNPLRYYFREDELIEHVVSGVKAREQFFENVAYEDATSIILSLILLDLVKNKTDTVLTMLEVKKWVDHRGLMDLKNSVEYYRHHPDVRIRQGIEQVLAILNPVVASPQEFFSKISSSLRTVLTTLTAGSTGRVIGRARENEFIRRLEAGEGVIFLCNTDPLIMQRSNSIVMKTVVSVLKAACGRITATRGKGLSRPLSVYMDEGHNVLFYGVQELFNKARAANVRIHFFEQSIDQMVAETSESTTKSILSNMDTWIIMRANEVSTLKYIEGLIPLVTKWTPIVQSGGGEFDFNVRADQVPAVDVQKMAYMKPRYFYLKGMNVEDFFKGRVPYLHPPSIRVRMPELSVRVL
jgi:hypothetical protein